MDWHAVNSIAKSGLVKKTVRFIKIKVKADSGANNYLSRVISCVA
jgi:hypothetical protein